MPKQLSGGGGGKAARGAAASVRAANAAASLADDGALSGVPKSFVYCAGRVPKPVRRLEKDMRRVMEPHTAAKLKERKKNTLKDFTSIAPQLGVTHFVVFSCSDVGTYVKIGRFPRGPTLTFRVQSFSLSRDIVQLFKRPHSPGKEFLTPPLVVLNNFDEADNRSHLMAVMFQNMFPPINVQTVQLKSCRRVVLLNHDAEHDAVEFRHYTIKASPVGLTRSVKRVIRAKAPPSLGDTQDIADYILGAGGGMSSDSEAEDTPDTRVVLQQDLAGRASGLTQAQQVAIRLTEVGPRLRLQLVKLQEGFMDGSVMYHRYVTKSPAEAQQLQARKEKEHRAKEEKRRKQERQRAAQQLSASSPDGPSSHRSPFDRDGYAGDDGGDSGDSADSADSADRGGTETKTKRKKRKLSQASKQPQKKGRLH
eukprot:gnl/Hemi2/4283_TR1498_c0_g1_i1.p1 gnl/Hemi2/4283_TR1498_c0_g1~~gnl/Hemi2/4283_TR1498_c0_g1_i1.p1  ORF type:complete len:422 (-),score=141.46 gnl/Hemi2/4283_TR1498_c0_g1_i1:31-1296(-)